MSGATDYRWLAECYDAIFEGWHQPIDAARDHCLKRILPHVKSACDLACGTGRLAAMLAARGIRMYGVDRSAAMCAVARRNAPGVKILRADMRDFRLPEQVDLITCEADAVNHLPSCSDLPKAAAAVARALRPGGHFFFDVNDREGFKRYWRGTMWIENPDAIVVMRNGNEWAEQRAWSDVECFTRKGKLWRRRTDRVEEVCWTQAEIREAMQQAGFDRVRHWDGARFFDALRPGCRSFYLARRAP